jgi:hypothetical protein
MLTGALVLLSTALCLVVLARPKLRRAPGWRATVTPLASIIGSGFLVLGPILNASYGMYAPLVMIALCAAAYAFGSAIRFNITNIETRPERFALEQSIERIASGMLAFAYCISVAYYLNLFGAFGVKMTPFNDPVFSKVLTSAVLLLILAVGWLQGFAAMERMEQFTVSLKLGIIAGLLVGLVVYFVKQTSDHALMVLPPSATGWAGITLAFGLIVTVQGFETSRYLGDEYDAGLRVRSMRLSQWIASGIYLAYALLLTYAFDASGIPLTETAIVDLLRVITIVLPVLLVIAALAAQFSAAVADTSGAGGLVAELSRGRIPARMAYLALVVIGLALTWFVHIFEIINYASKAFALYYALQCAIAALGCFRETRQPWRGGFYASCSVLALAVVAFGKAVEGSA